MLGPRRLKNVGEPVELLALRPRGRALSPAVDPVCRMRLAVTAASVRRAHAGDVVHFCSEHCAATFDRRPELFARRAALTPAG